MKDWFLLLFISTLCFGQDNHTLFLDSSLKVIEVDLSENLSLAQRRDIYHYAEIEFNQDGNLSRSQVYFAAGKEPKVANNGPEWKYLPNKITYFRRPENRSGSMRSEIIYSPAIQIRLEDIKAHGIPDVVSGVITKRYPNGKLMHKTTYVDGITEDITMFKDNGDKYSTYYYGSKGDLTSWLVWSDGFKYENRYLSEDKSLIQSTSIELTTGNKVATRIYKDGVEQTEKTQIFSSTGRNIYNLLEENKNETSLKSYFQNNETPLIEGIYTVKENSGTRNYRLAILEGYDGRFFAYQISGFMYNADNWDAWEIRAVFEESAVDGYYNVTWLNDYKKQEVSQITELVGGAICEFGNYSMVKLYPSLKHSTNSDNTYNNDWKGNGSGIIINKEGYFLTNHHVIEDANEIEVEFMIDGGISQFDAEIILIDKTNDLALLKISDINFNGTEEPPYNFKSRSSEVGTKVYAYGYPMALSIMGKEIKVTDGIISAKSGYDGNITTYQITAPIQPGNSGGPLFDDKGNLIGINSSGLSKDLADNVSYSIKLNYVLNLIDVLPQSIELPESLKLSTLPLTEQVKEISKYVVLIKVK